MYIIIATNIRHAPQRGWLACQRFVRGGVCVEAYANLNICIMQI
jgi:hypothetical protein